MAHPKPNRNTAGAGKAELENPAGSALVPVSGPSALVSRVGDAGELPAIVLRAGSAAVFAAEEFFFGTIRNEHTRRAYLHAVRQFLAWCETRSLELPRIAPRDVGQYLTSLAKTTCGFRSDGDHESEVMSISNPN